MNVNQKKKGFTIVELVIVIAVVAVLAAVMIPTFASIIESANLSNDTSLVANINKVLKVEDILSGGPNDAVEIQKRIKSYGLSLETKSKGNYLWYDIDNERVVLAGLNETGIALDNISAQSDEDEIVSEIPKGYYKAPVSPEDFVQGYLFLSETSADGLAQAVHAIRNPKFNESDADDANVVASLQKALTDLEALKTKVPGTEQVVTLMQGFMNKTAIMTEKGTTYVGTTGADSVLKVIVSSGMTKITDEAITGLSDFPQLFVVDLHSDVVNITAEAITELINAGKINDGGEVKGIYFVYCNNEIKAIDEDAQYGGDIANLISVEQRSQVITTLRIVKYYLNKDGTPAAKPLTQIGNLIEYLNEEGEYNDGFFKHVVKYDFPALATEHNADSVYGFTSYSFYPSDSAEKIEIGTQNHIIGEDEQILIKNGTLTVYAFYQELNADFRIKGLCYTSEEVTEWLSDSSVTKDSLGDTITVISKTATLGDANHTELYIPEKVELLLPYNTVDFTKGVWNEFISLGVKEEDFVAVREQYNKANIEGKTQLEIAENVTLNVATDASIYIDAQCHDSLTFLQCYVKDICGVLILNGKIVSKGDITVLGVIRGNGTIEAQSGSIGEIMTIYDWYGGTNAAMAVGVPAGMLGNMIGIDASGKNTLPFNNWEMDHIRVKVAIKSSATYKAITAVAMEGVTPDVIFELAGPSNALFVMSTEVETEIVRTISKDGDAKFIILKGLVQDAAKQLVLEDVVSVFDATIDFTQISMPLSNFDVDVASGATLTLSKNLYKMLPGSTVTVQTGTNDKGERVDGVLNINTKVAVYNNYGLAHKLSDSTEVINKTSLGSPLEQYLTKYTISPDGTYYIGLKYHQKREKQGLISFTDWENIGGDPEIVTVPYSDNPNSSIAIPRTYNETTPAQFIIDGTLNFNSDNGSNAAFAGEILSTKSGATIKVTGTVNGYTIPEGFGINKTWYYMDVVGLYSQAFINEVQQSLSGTYTSSVYTVGEGETARTYVNWAQ